MDLHASNIQLNLNMCVDGADGQPSLRSFEWRALFWLLGCNVAPDGLSKQPLLAGRHSQQGLSREEKYPKAVAQLILYFYELLTIVGGKDSQGIKIITNDVGSVSTMHIHA